MFRVTSEELCLRPILLNRARELTTLAEAQAVTFLGLHNGVKVAGAPRCLRSCVGAAFVSMVVVLLTRTGDSSEFTHPLKGIAAGRTHALVKADRVGNVGGMEECSTVDVDAQTTPFAFAP